MQVDKQKLVHALKTVLFNHLCISGPMVVGAYQLMTLRGDPCGPQLPTFHRALMELAAFSVLEELIFYYSHRWMRGSSFSSKQRRPPVARQKNANAFSSSLLEPLSLLVLNEGVNDSPS